MDSFFLVEQRLKLCFLQFEKRLGLLIEPHGNTTSFTVVSIFLDIKYFKAVSVLNDPNVIGLLSGLTGTINRVNTDILVVIGFSRVDNNHDMNIEWSGYFS